MPNPDYLIQQLHSAWNQGKVPVFEELLFENLGSLDVSKIDKSGRTILWLAASIGSSRSIEILLKRGAGIEFKCPVTGYTPLHAAVFWGHPDAVIRLINKKASVNVVDKHGQTPLILATINGNADITKALIDGKADVNMRDKDGGTGLIIASARRRTDIVELLLKNRAQVNMQDNAGRTALMQAGNLQIVQLLLEYGADERARDQSGRTVYNYMANRPEVLSLLP